jgi:hypothetical protein
MNTIEWLKNNKKDIFFFVGLVAAVWFIYLIGKNRPVSEITSTWSWILFIMVLFIILASSLITKNPLFGWLINEQNRMSLSRLQMFLWTIVILSAFITAVFANLHFKQFDSAVAIAIPEELWLAMGISTTSLVGTSLILESKKPKDPKLPIDPNQLKDPNQPTPLKKLDDKLESMKIKRIGVLVSPEKPSLLDLIRGEELGNYDKIDLTRLQNLFFTFILVGTYMASLNVMFSELVTKTPEIQDIAENFPIASFPELGSSAIALLAISHAGYLVVKAIDKQQTETPETP